MPRVLHGCEIVRNHTIVHLRQGAFESEKADDKNRHNQGPNDCSEYARGDVRFRLRVFDWFFPRSGI